jgi:hypothetical protein
VFILPLIKLFEFCSLDLDEKQRKKNVWNYGLWLYIDNKESSFMQVVSRQCFRRLKETYQQLKNLVARIPRHQFMNKKIKNLRALNLYFIVFLMQMKRTKILARSNVLQQRQILQKPEDWNILCSLKFQQCMLTWMFQRSMLTRRQLINEDHLILPSGRRS